MSDQPRHRRNLRLVQAALAGVLVLPSVSACGHSASYDQYANCVNAQGQVVPNNYCDDSRYYGSSGGYFIFMAPTLYSSGAFVPSGSRSSFISPGDPVARSRAGLPGSGRVGGTTVRSGGIGKGSGSSGGSSSRSSSHYSSGS